jgi:hypothetical protein
MRAPVPPWLDTPNLRQAGVVGRLWDTQPPGVDITPEPIPEPEPEVQIGVPEGAPKRRIKT